MVAQLTIMIIWLIAVCTVCSFASHMSSQNQFFWSNWNTNIILLDNRFGLLATNQRSLVPSPYATNICVHEHDRLYCSGCFQCIICIEKCEEKFRTRRLCLFGLFVFLKVLTWDIYFWYFGLHANYLLLLLLIITAFALLSIYLLGVHWKPSSLHLSLLSKCMAQCWVDNLLAHFRLQVFGYAVIVKSFIMPN